MEVVVGEINQSSGERGQGWYRPCKCMVVSAWEFKTETRGKKG